LAATTCPPPGSARRSRWPTRWIRSRVFSSSNSARPERRILSALRRAALGVLRILIEKNIDLDLSALVALAVNVQPVARPAAAGEVQEFLFERLRGLILERGDGTTAEMIEAVNAVQPRSPLDALARLQALREFLLLPDAAVLAAANKRIANLLKKAPPGATAAPLPERFVVDAERTLHAAFGHIAADVASALARRQYAQALGMLATLRGPIDGFFDEVMVMDEDLALRHNRLGLLRVIQSAFGAVADLSRLPGPGS
jgi:glycyl-tRNA synthetase beta chain